MGDRAGREAVMRQWTRQSSPGSRLAERSRRQLVDAIETLAGGFVLYDEDDRLVLCNDHYRELYALSAAALVAGARFEDILRYGLEREQYADAVGREEAWLAARLQAHRRSSSTIEQRLSSGRYLRIIERTTIETRLRYCHPDDLPLDRRPGAPLRRRGAVLRVRGAHAPQGRALGLGARS